MKKELSIIAFSLAAATVISAMPVMAQQQVPPPKTDAQVAAEESVVSGRQGDVKDAIKNMGLRIQEQTASFSDAKKTAIDSFYYEIIALNSNYIDYSLEVLGRMEIILGRARVKVEATAADGRDVGNSQALIPAAQTVIDNARNSLVAQSKVVYDFNAGTESSLKAEARKTKVALVADLQKVRTAVIAARNAVAGVIVEFNQSQAVVAQ